MNNSQIADLFKLHSQLMDINGANSFRSQSYSVASFRIDKMQIDLTKLSEEELANTQYIGKGLAGKIREMVTTGSFKDLDELLASTPKGVVDMLQIKGIGPKKIKVLWKELGLTSVGELYYACKENRLTDLKGFGVKTQDKIIESIDFMMANSNRFHYARVEELAISILDDLNDAEGITQASMTGQIRRKTEVVDSLDFVIDAFDYSAIIEKWDLEEEDDRLVGTINNVPVNIYITSGTDFTKVLFKTTATEEHISKLDIAIPSSPADENEIYKENGLPYIEPEMREGVAEIHYAKAGKMPVLVEYTDLKGILHNHTTYSDGANTLREMAEFCKKEGYEYLGVCDHSKTAVYANGLDVDRVYKQQQEIDQLNAELGTFKIFKGIESDILGDGSLDYENDVLASFDFVVASVHSNLTMNEEKANERIIKAIENPYTTILGHPTGRLLLMRKGYPVDHKLMIDACAANNVIIEINANPYRLDLDWRWIDYALSKGVKLSINPDAHSTKGYSDMYYGTCVARKGGLTKDMTFNALTADEIGTYFADRKSKI